MRRLLYSDAAEYKTRGADALKIHVSGEVVAARAQRFERWRELRLERDETAHWRRGPFAQGHPNPFELLIDLRSCHAFDTQSNPIRALALLSHFNETRDVDIPCGRSQHRMSNDHPFYCGTSEPRRSHRDA
jgi:hypothetical protein